ncbi:NUDIX hydrolase [Streptacidiphilus sp. PAMC 29251]
MADESLKNDDLIRAAGVVLWRPGRSGGPELALIHRPKWGDWTFPKGKLEVGERHRDAARREAWEETGMLVELRFKLPTQRYEVKGRPKRVRYWAAVRVGGAFAANREVDRLVWLPAAAARERLSYGHDQELVDALLAASAQLAADPS